MSNAIKITTDRLVIRPLQNADARALSALRSDPRVSKFIERTPNLSPADALTTILEKQEAVSRGEICYWAIALKPSDELIGTICLFNFDDEKMEAEVGYEIASRFQGKGLISEALTAVLNYAFYDRKRLQVVAFTKAANHASIKLLERFGFQRNVARSRESEHYDVFMKQLTC